MSLHVGPLATALNTAHPKLGVMVLRLASKLLWGTTKFTVKYVVVPLAYTAVMAALISTAADKIREKTDNIQPVIRPEP
jgi:hypothetical protein